MFLCKVLTYDNNEEDETTSLDAESTGMGTQTKSTKSGQTNSSLNMKDKIDQQLAEDLKNIDDRGAFKFTLDFFICHL